MILRVAAPGVPDMPSGILELDMELARASISTEVKDLQVGANLTRYIKDGIYIRTSDLPMYSVR